MEKIEGKRKRRGRREKEALHSGSGPSLRRFSCRCATCESAVASGWSVRGQPILSSVRTIKGNMVDRIYTCTICSTTTWTYFYSHLRSDFTAVNEASIWTADHHEGKGWNLHRIMQWLKQHHEKLRTLVQWDMCYIIWQNYRIWKQ